MRDGIFLQSPAWETVEQQVGHTTHRIDDVLVIERATPLGVYWYIGRATLTTQQIETIAEAAKLARVLFVRLDPLNQLVNGKQLTVNGTDSSQFTVHSSPSTQPQTTLVLDLAPTEEALLQSFHEKTRYNIRLAERKGVMIEESTDPTHQNFAAFIALSKQMGSRQGIRLHGESYYHQMLETLNRGNLPQPLFSEREKNPVLPSLGKEGQGEISASIVTAYSGDQPLAANLMLWTDNTAYYLHGASDHSARKLMAPPLLQWACIQRAKTRGIAAYDFWGVAPATGKLLVANGKLSESPPSPNDNSPLTTHHSPRAEYQFSPEHPWAGITRFKLGFGGQVVRYPDSIDLVLDPFRYRVYQAGRMLRRSVARMIG